MKPVFEAMGGTCRRKGNCLIPDPEPPDTKRYQIGKYGHLRQTYLREHRPSLYNDLILSGTLFRHLAEVDQTCYERVDLLTRQMARREGVTEALKAVNQLEWVGRMNNLRSRAEEIVLAEVVYE